jgi:xanthine dehydrogenase small subunit
MRTTLAELRLLEPRSLRDALCMLRDEGPLTPLAGGTDVFVSLNFGTEKGRRFLNLWRLRELSKIDVRGEVLAIGALATFTDIVRSPLVRRRIPMLAAAAREIGGVQIQNRATLGGNIANASPAADSLPVLAAADATIVLASHAGTRRVPLGDFYTGYRRTVMRPDELVVAVEVPRIRGRQWFRKVGTRAALAISKVVFAGVRAPRPRIALGSVGATVLRAPRTEDLLAAGGSSAEAERMLMEEIQPIDDLRSTAAYRRHVAANLLARFLLETETRRDDPRRIAR